MTLAAWMDGYVRAWTSNAPEEIGELFTADAVYDPQTGDGPWTGRDEIVAGWQEIGDEAGSWTFDWEPLVDEPALAIITGRTVYADEDARSYRNLWVMRFEPDHHRCIEFTEWWIEE